MKNWAALSLIVGLFVRPSPTDDAAVLLEADRAFCSDTTEHGVEGWLSWFAPDGVVATPTGELRTGMEEIESYYRSLAFPPPGFRWEPDAAALSESGELGYTVGSWEIRPPVAAADAPFPKGRYLSVWRRQPDDSFRVIADLGGSVDFRTRLEGAAGPALDWSCTTERFELAESGELGITLGTWSARSEDPESGEEAEHEGRGLSVWTRTAENAWKVAAEIGFEISR